MAFFITLVLVVVLATPAVAFPQKIWIDDALGLREAQVVPAPSFKERHPRWWKFGKVSFLVIEKTVIIGGGIAQWVTAAK